MVGGVRRGEHRYIFWNAALIDKLELLAMRRKTGEIRTRATLACRI